MLTATLSLGGFANLRGVEVRLGHEDAFFAALLIPLCAVTWCELAATRPAIPTTSFHAPHHVVDGLLESVLAKVRLRRFSLGFMATGNPKGNFAKTAREGDIPDNPSSTCVSTATFAFETHGRFLVPLTGLQSISLEACTSADERRIADVVLSATGGDAS